MPHKLARWQFNKPKLRVAIIAPLCCKFTFPAELCEAPRHVKGEQLAGSGNYSYALLAATLP